MTREVYCGFPVYGPLGEVINLQSGFTITSVDNDQNGQVNFIRQIKAPDYLDSPNKYDDYLYDSSNRNDRTINVFTQDYALPGGP